MSPRTPSILRDALGLLRIRHVLQQIALVTLVASLSVLWLHLPDASVMDALGTVLLGLAVIWIWGAGETALFLRFCDMPRTKGRLLRGTVLLLVGIALWLGACSLLKHMQSGDALRAGYLNSRVSFRQRNLFSFAHILLWLGWMWTTLKWVLAGVIAGFAFPAMASARPLGAVGQVLRSISYWILLLPGTVAAALITGLLMQWTPGHGLRIESASLVLRLAVAVSIDCALAVVLLAVLAVCVRRSGYLYEIPEGTPDASHPRTVDNP